MVTHTPQQLRQALRYEDGNLYWLEDQPASRQRFAGKRAGSRRPNSTGYITVCLNGKAYLAHRVIWAIVHGRWPAEEIDHINHVRDDNRIENLREATRSQNFANNSGYRRREPLPKGVSRVRERFRARIRKHGVIQHLGYFPTAEAAHAAYCEAADIAWGPFSCHGEAA